MSHTPPSIALAAPDAFVSPFGIARMQTELITRLCHRADLHLLMLKRVLAKLGEGPLPGPLQKASPQYYSAPSALMAGAPRILGRCLNRRDLWTRPLSQMMSLLSQRVFQGVFVDRRRYDLLHATANFVPDTRGPTKRIITVHDTIPLIHPDGLPAIILKGFLRKNELRSDDVIVTDSNASRADILERFGAGVERVRVIPLGVDLDYFGAKSALPTAPQAPFLFTVSILAQHKNLVRGLRAFEQLAQRHPELMWKIAGPKGWGADEFLAAVENSPAKDRIVVMGRVSDAQLRSHYRGAAAFFLPTMAEGFGVPLLEAMAAGAVTAVSDIGALREIGGEAPFYFDPQREETMVKALESALVDERERRRKLGLEQAARFTWERTAETYLKLYAEVLGTDVAALAPQGNG